MKKVWSTILLFLVAVTVFFSGAESAWATAIEIAIDEDCAEYISKVEAIGNDVPEGLTLYRGWREEPGSVNDPDKEAYRRFEDFVYKDFGGADGAEEADDRAHKRTDALNEEDFKTKEEYQDAFLRIMFEESYTKMGEKLMWSSPMNFYLVDENGDDYKYDGEGIKMTAPFMDTEDIEMLDKYIGDYEILVLHEKYDEDNDKYEYEYLPANIVSIEGVEGVVGLEFTTKSLSPFAAILSGKVTEAPKTIDNAVIFVNIAGVGSIGLFALGVWLGRKERR